MAAQYHFKTRIARRLPDPIFEGITRHVMFVAIKDVPADLLRDANVRPPNIDRRVYREVEESMLDHNSLPGTFHLKHKGVTILADKVESATKDEYVVTMVEGQGIVDGGHTDEIIARHREDPDIPENQYLKFEILTGVPQQWISEIAGGLNTSMQVQPMSLDNKRELFVWMQDELRDEPYYGKLAWRENDQGELDARDLIALLTCVNIYLWPNGEDTEYPVVAYSSKARALDIFEEKQAEYVKLRPILKDVLHLFDTIRLEARDLHNKAGGKGGALSFVERRKRGMYEFPIVDRKSDFRLMNGAAYPMLGAFRWMVEEDPNGTVRWRGGFDSVLELWGNIASELMKVTQLASDDLGRNPMALGKSKNLWAQLYKTVGFRDMMARHF